MKIKEFLIPVPWGVVAAKAWGNEKNTPVLMIHGWFDNAGSFDQLIPHLPEIFYYICIDLPCHGKSSQFPPHLPINPLNVILTYKIVMDYLNRTKYIIIAHSWGGRTAVLFSQLYPEYILKLIILDAIYLPIFSASDIKQAVRGQNDEIIQINEKVLIKSAPLHTYDEALKRVCESRVYGGILKKEAGEALLKRSLIPAGNGKFQFSNDLRLKVNAITNLFYDKKFVEGFVKECPVESPIIFIIVSDSIIRHQPFDWVVKELQKRNNKCFVKKVEGGHDVHMNEPQVVAAIINTFLTSSKL